MDYNPKRKEIEEKVVEYLTEYAEEYNIEDANVDELAEEICTNLIGIKFDKNGNQISYLWEVTNIVNEFISNLKNRGEQR